MLKGGAIYGGTEILRKVSPFLLLPFFINYLSIDSFGKLEFVTVISTLFSFLIGWGSSQGLLRFYVEDKIKYTTATLQLIIIIFISLLSFGVLCSSLFNNFWDKIGVESFEVYLLCLMFGFVLSFNNIAFTILRIEERILKFAVLNLITVTFQVILVLFCLTFFKLDYLSKVYGLVIANLLLSVVLYKNIISKSLSFDFSFNHFNTMLSFYSPIALTNLLGWGKNSVDRVVIKLVLGDEALGLYAVTIQFIQIFKLGCESFLKYFNVIAYKNEEFINSIKKHRFTVSLGVSGLAAIYGFLVILVNDYIAGVEYQLSMNLFLVLLFSRVLLLVNYIETILFYAKLQSKIVMVINIISFSILLILIYPFTVYYGLLGTAISVLCSAALGFILLTYKNVRVISIPVFLLILTPLPIIMLYVFTI